MYFWDFCLCYLNLSCWPEVQPRILWITSNLSWEIYFLSWINLKKKHKPHILYYFEFNMETQFRHLSPFLFCALLVYFFTHFHSLKLVLRWRLDSLVTEVAWLTGIKNTLQMLRLLWRFPTLKVKGSRGTWPLAWAQQWQFGEAGRTAHPDQKTGKNWETRGERVGVQREGC